MGCDVQFYATVSDFLTLKTNGNYKAMLGYQVLDKMYSAGAATDYLPGHTEACANHAYNYRGSTIRDANIESKESFEKFIAFKG